MRFGVLRLALAGILLCGMAAWSCGSNNGSGTTTPTPIPVPGGGGGGSADVTITILGMNGAQSYSPNPATVRVGQTVAWHNGDAVAHTATADSGAFSTGSIAPGATSAPITMATAGTLAYHCQIHPSMTGTVSVQ
jgi:plastocyanin